MQSILLNLVRPSYLRRLTWAFALLLAAGLVNTASAQTTVLFDFESLQGEQSSLDPTFIDGDSGFFITHSAGDVRGNTQWTNDGRCIAFSGTGCMRLSDEGVGATPVTGSINFSEPVDSISVWASSLAVGATVTPVLEGGGLGVSRVVSDPVYAQLLFSGQGPYVGLQVASPAVNTLAWDDLQVTFGGPAIVRDALLGAESEDGNLLAIDPENAEERLVIGDTGIVPLNSLAKGPISGRLFGGDEVDGAELPGRILYTYQTIIEMTPHDQEPAPDGIDTVIIDWSTEQTQGNLSQFDLDFLSIELLAGQNSVYQDTAIIDGAGQPLGGAIRSVDDMFWDFNLETLVLSQIVSAADAVIEESAGTQYQVADGVAIPVDGELRFTRYNNGDPSAYGLGTNIVQSTQLVSIDGGASLYEIDERTGASRQIGVLRDDISAMNSADFDADGQLWAVVRIEGIFGGCEGECPETYEALAKIDTNDGSAEVIGEGFFELGIDGISFDGNGVLWGVSSTNDALYQFDLVEGTVEFITGVTVGDGQPVPGGGFASLQFACDANPFDEGLGILYAGLAESDGGGGFLYTIDPESGDASQVNDSSSTNGSSLGGLALHTTCGEVISNVPTPEGDDVVVISIDVFEQVASNVVVAGTTNASFCVVPDIRYTPNGSGGFDFTARNLNVSELVGMGSCKGALVPGQPETWETDIFPSLDLVIASWYQSYRGKFKAPGQATPQDGYWLVLGVVRSTAEFDGPVAYTNYPETLIDYSATALGEQPECTNELPYRSLDIAGTVPDFGDFANIEGNRMIVETGQCNRNRGITRRTTHISPVRYVYPKAGARGEAVNLNIQFTGLSATFREAAVCADAGLIANMQASLRTAQYAVRYGNYDDAEEALEEIARSAKNDASFGSGFSSCPVERNYRGNFISRAVTAAFTVHDRFQHPNAYVKYFPPADLEIPILDSE